MHVHEELSDWLNGDLDSRRSVEIARHLLSCDECAARTGGLEAIRTLARREAPRPPEGNAWPGIAKAIGASGDLPAAAASRRKRPADPRDAERVDRRPGTETWWKVGLAAAAACMLFGGGLGLGIGAFNLTSAITGVGAGIDVRAVTGVLAILVVLAPVMALAIRLSIPAVVKAFREDLRPQVIDRIDERLGAVADEVAHLTTEQERLAEKVEFDRRLSGEPLDHGTRDSHREDELE